LTPGESYGLISAGFFTGESAGPADSREPYSSLGPGLAEIFEPVRDELARVEREFAVISRSRVELIPQMGKYVQMSGGKRVRPAVLLMARALCGYTGDAPSSTRPSSSSSTPRRSSTTTSSTAPRPPRAG
jgi:hypothetical protein